MPNPENYTVGWICAISTEYVAARAFLDEKHDGPEYVSPNDNNDYTLGTFGKHNVVIAVLPDGEYGTASAAIVARDMLHSFPNIRIGLMVGIGGGAPSMKHDIRLGDVVVSAPRDGEGGVFQYDFGKTIQNQSFQYTQFLNQPPIVLRTAVNGLKAQYMEDGHRIEETISTILDKKSRLRQVYKRPDTSSDRLYRSEVVHLVDGKSCAAICSDDPSSLLTRTERTQNDDNPAIHYGTIASANQLMKNAIMRDRLAAEKDVLCFEMEAAGLMNHFPCLVIRGICDYSDSHKNKEWQGYAAMTAAAYAKDVLTRIPPNKIEAEKKISDILSEHREIAREQRDIAKEQRDIATKHLQVQRDFAKERLSEKEEKCHQLFRLTTDGNGATYEWYKDRVEEKVEDTCMWFLKHEHFQMWLKKDSGLLLVSADPGCGKSVLAKYLVDYGLPQSATICYFFFKDQDQNTVRQALCALLHQLFSQKPHLIGHAMTEFRKDGHALINSTESLWKVLRNTTEDPQAGPIIIVLDALDECAESEFADLMRNMENQSHSEHSRLRYLLTCRPYEQIISKFRSLLNAFPNIRIPGEEESEAISREVNHVIKHRIHQLSEQKGLSTQVVNHLENYLQEAPHRTYLWVYLIFDYLEKEDFKKTLKGVKSSITQLPRNINDAYEQILSRSKEHPMVQKALSIILAASRPLSLSEMNIAINIDNTSQSINDLDLEDEKDFELRLRSWCGLFISIYHDKIYFLHQTAREFLLAPTTIPSKIGWRHSIAAHHAHAVLAELCVLYLNFFNSNISLPTGTDRENRHSVNSNTFLDYSAKAWGAHFRQASIIDNAAIICSALRICDPDSKSYSVWSGIYWQSIGVNTPKYFTGLMVASHYGHRGVVKLLLEKGANVNAQDGGGWTPLSWAADGGHEAVVKLLLKKGAKVDAQDRYGQTPLRQAADGRHEAVIKLLLEKGANVNAQDNSGRTPLSQAIAWGHEAVVKLLIKKGANINAQHSGGQTPLWQAVAGGHEAVVKLLLEEGANINAQDRYGQTLLSQAANRGYKAIVKLLLEKGAKVDAQDRYGQTPLQQAADGGHEAVVKLLLEKGAKVDAQDRYGQTPLWQAVAGGHEAVVKLLLEEGANINAQDRYGQTLLLQAANRGHKAVVKLLLEKGANINAQDRYGQTPLSQAADRGHKAVVELLLKMGANHKNR